MQYRLEVIGYNIESCAIAQAAGAHRIELCHNPADGGTTPSYGFIKAARELLTIDLYPIIRPRGGDFHFNDMSFEMMKTDISICKELGADGVSIGMLTAEGTVDKIRCYQLVELAYPLGVTFHRAFDRTRDPLQALEDIIDIGCERLLTSGQRPTALEGADLIQTLVGQAGDRLIIMPGSGVRSGNIAALAQQTGVTELHSSAASLNRGSMNFLNNNMKEELVYVITDGDEVTKMIGQLQTLPIVE